MKHPDADPGHVEHEPLGQSRPQHGIVHVASYRLEPPERTQLV
jgi:hypothetical protein